ncbi:MAG TPA: class I SAM-dependent methyltransferase [Ignavibacteria bacterium]|nr:class I SAM-dependent methyltransferase [Ignavibacteria bacterium]HMQ98484.1 class I SAM-dependent methyltransferase [Ignavibacteria bacterium]
MSENSIQFTASIAENYEKYLAPVFFISTSKDLVSHLKGSPVKILEIAAGTGQVTRNIVKVFPEAKITATDINPGMLDVGKKIVPSGNINWQAADACELPFEDSSFDAIICQFGVMFFPDKQKAMNEAFRVLKPGGQIVFNTWDSLENNRICMIPEEVINRVFPDDPPPFYKIPFSMYDPAEIEALMKTAGFSDIKIENKRIEGYSESPDNAVTAFTEGNPIYLQIMERDPAILPVFQKMLKEELIKEFGPGRFTIPLSEFIATAHK